MKRVDEVQQVIPGEYYLVDCVCLDKTDDPQFDVRLLEEQNRYEYLPILGPAHTDNVLDKYGLVAQFSFIGMHYHLDQRFMTDDQMKKRVILFTEYGQRDKVVNWAKEQFACGPWRETTVVMKCIRKDFPVKVVLPNLEKKFKYAINNRCPHKGAYLGNLEVVDNCVRCPMHGLRFDAYTKQCVGGGHKDGLEE